MNAKKSKCFLCRRLLGITLALSASASNYVGIDMRLDLKKLIMLGAACRHELVGKRFISVLLNELLKPRFIVKNGRMLG